MDFKDFIESMGIESSLAKAFEDWRYDLPMAPSRASWRACLVEICCAATELRSGRAASSSSDRARKPDGISESEEGKDRPRFLTAAGGWDCCGLGVEAGVGRSWRRGGVVMSTTLLLLAGPTDGAAFVRLLMVEIALATRSRYSGLARSEIMGSVEARLCMFAHCWDMRGA